MLCSTILIAVGANLPGLDGGSPLETCRRAVRLVGALPGLHLLACSRFYRSTPVPPSGQPDYVNAVARYRGEAEPARLLAALHRIEMEEGRVRTTPNAARTLDLDLLAMDDLVVRTKELVLPHPRLQDRAFVLAPLCDVFPGWRTVDGQVAQSLLAGVDRAGLSVLAEG